MVKKCDKKRPVFPNESFYHHNILLHSASAAAAAAAKSRIGKIRE